MKKKPTKYQIEKAAHAVIKIINPHGGGDWNPEFIKEARWPKDFYPMERKFARSIARAALSAALT